MIEIYLKDNKVISLESIKNKFSILK